MVLISTNIYPGDRNPTHSEENRSHPYVRPCASALSACQTEAAVALIREREGGEEIHLGRDEPGGDARFGGRRVNRMSYV